MEEKNMDWNLYWVILMPLSIAVAICNFAIIIFSKKNKITTNMCCVFLSTLLGAVSILQDILAIKDWIIYGEISNLEEHVLSIAKLDSYFILILGILNTISIILIIVRKRTIRTE